jgi:hypothetical protein
MDQPKDEEKRASKGKETKEKAAQPREENKWVLDSPVRFIEAEPDFADHSLFKPIRHSILSLNFE